MDRYMLPLFVDEHSVDEDFVVDDILSLATDRTVSLQTRLAATRRVAFSLRARTISVGVRPPYSRVVDAVLRLLGTVCAPRD